MFIIYLGKWSNLTSMVFQMGWNHQVACCLGYIGYFNIQSYGGIIYDKPFSGSLINNQSSGKEAFFFFVAQMVVIIKGMPLVQVKEWQWWLVVGVISCWIDVSFDKRIAITCGFSSISIFMYIRRTKIRQMISWILLLNNTQSCFQ